jgi:pilus assembly protein CpaB
MNRTRLLMIGALALALGAVVSLSVYKNLQGRGPSTVETGADVIVAANDIQVGARVEDHDVRVAKFPVSGLPAGSYSKKSQVLGRGVIIPVSKGEFLLPSKLAPENAGSGLPSLIPPGMRAVSVRVNEVVSVAGFVAPGTRVDVLLTGTPNGSSESQTTTVLQNVAVIASGHTLERNAAGETVDSRQRPGPYSALPAQPARHPAGRGSGRQCKGPVQGWYTGGAGAGAESSRKGAKEVRGTAFLSFGPQGGDL